ncbi:MAG TPA: M67 family metallopeptidase [Rhizomicrobium sp.]|nr:M67 family metallopeptidase [Rhizomicrobium sp.]
MPQELRARIEECARESFPRECCGLIAGTREGDIALALALHPARNIATRADRFEIEPGDHLRALKQARANGHVLIGCYHSHPNGEPKPSANDLAGAGEEDFLWLIAALSSANGPLTLAAFDYSAAAYVPAELVSAIGAD